MAEAIVTYAVSKFASIIISKLARARAPAPGIESPRHAPPDCIFRASAQIRYGRESDFEPKLVSIGPYYHGRDENLKRMEEIKLKCMHDMRTMGSTEGPFPFHQFAEFESKVRRFYKEEVRFGEEQFVQMLVYDSCFVIRIMLSFSPNISECLAFLDLNIKEAVSDLLLLENQIPLFFIKKVFYEIFSNINDENAETFHGLLLNMFMQLDLPWWTNSDHLPINSDHLANSDHLFHVCWKISEGSIKKKHYADSLIYNQPANVRHRRVSQEKLIMNATELHQMARISFKNVETDDGCVEFSKGIIWMPRLKIDSSQTTLLVNLMAFENSMLQPSNRTISTYIKIMDDLIDSDKDVELLQKFGVVYNTLSNHTKAATFFNDIGNLCLIDYKKNPFSDLFENVNEYYKSWWNRSWASLLQNYFNSPWSLISVLAGVTLLFLAGAQTYYTVFPKK